MNKVPKGSKNFECATCDYNTSRHSQYMRHLMTPKHKNRTNIEQKGSESSEAYKCECGKKYKARNSLWYHKQKCKLLILVIECLIGSSIKPSVASPPCKCATGIFAIIAALTAEKISKRSPKTTTKSGFKSE